MSKRTGLSKIEPQARVAWRFDQYRQTLHPENPKLGTMPCVAWRPGMCRQAVFGKFLETQKFNR